MEYKVDYHMHSYYSDGLMKPTDVVKMRSEQEYDIIALTDHDTIDGVSEAVIAGDALNIKVVPGIELSAAYDKDTELHILGYNIDIENKKLNDVIEYLAKARNERNEKYLKQLAKLGYPLEESEYITRKGQKIVSKAHFARALIKRGYGETIGDIFKKIFSDPSLKAIKQNDISPKEAIETINGASGIAVLAHPGKIKNMGEKGTEEWLSNIEKLVLELKEYGLKGIECFHPSQDEHVSGQLANLASKHHLHMTKGSDFHGLE